MFAKVPEEFWLPSKLEEMQSKRETMNQRCGILNQIDKPKTSTEESMVGEKRCSSIEVFSY